MQLGIRGKLFAVSVVLIVFVVATSGIWLESQLRGWLENRIEESLYQHARAAKALIEAVPEAGDTEVVDALVDRFGTAIGARFTLIDAAGTVLGDSELSLEQVRNIESHTDRPERRQAAESGEAAARRYSNTLRTDMLYVAVAYERPDGSGVVRVAMPLRAVDVTIGRLRTFLLVAGLLGLLVALIMSGLASELMSRTVRDLVRNAREVVEGTSHRKVPVVRDDELGTIARSFNRMSDELEDVVSKLAEERDRLGAVLEGMDAAVLAVDSDLNITMVNSSARDMLSLDSSPKGRPLVEVVRVPDLHALVRDGRDEPDNFVEFDLEGPKRRTVVARVTPQRSTAGAVLVIHDITRLRRLETVRRDFVANVSHELRTPISVIRANAETLLGGALDSPEPARKFVEATLRNAERLSRLIADLLDLSQIESGNYQMNLEKVDVEQLSRRVVTALEHRIQAKSMVVRVDVDPSSKALADERALEQILTNFVDNAVKYTPAEGTIVVRSHQKDGGVRIEVEDDGPGVPPEHRARLFERFYRVDPGRSREMGGTGLGLSIVKHLASAMYGCAGMQPASLQGSVFWVELGSTESGVYPEPAGSRVDMTEASPVR